MISPTQWQEGEVTLSESFTEHPDQVSSCGWIRPISLELLRVGIVCSDSLGFTLAQAGYPTERKGARRVHACLLTSHTCICFYTLPHLVFTLQSRSYHSCFVNEDISGFKRWNKLLKGSGGVWFQIWDFLALKPVPIPFWNLCSGKGEREGRFWVKQQCSHLRGSFPNSLLLGCGVGHGLGWGWGHGGLGKMGKVGWGKLSSAWHWLANSRSMEVLDLQMFSWPRSCPSKGQLEWFCFLK